MPTGGGGGGGVLAGRTFYHGTGNKVAAAIQQEGFDLSHESEGGDTIGGKGSPDVAAGIYFSEEQDLAATYASQMEAAARGMEEPGQELAGDKGTVLHAQINVDKVAEGEDTKRLFNETFERMAGERGVDPTGEGARYSLIGGPQFAAELTKTAQAQGYQALRGSVYGGDELIVFDPANIHVVGSTKLG